MHTDKRVCVYTIMGSCVCGSNSLNLQRNEVLLYLIQKLLADISTTGFDVGSRSCLDSSCRLRLCKLLSRLYVSPHCPNAAAQPSSSSFLKECAAPAHFETQSQPAEANLTADSNFLS